MSNLGPVDLERAKPTFHFLERLGELPADGCVGSDHESSLLKTMRKGEVRPADDDEGKDSEEDSPAEQEK